MVLNSYMQKNKTGRTSHININSEYKDLNLKPESIKRDEIS